MSLISIRSKFARYLHLTNKGKSLYYSRPVMGALDLLREELNDRAIQCK